jgi:hypothetical protein
LDKAYNKHDDNAVGSLLIMSTDLVCPDCGGIIGGTPDDRGHACTCGLQNATAGGLHSASHADGDTVIEKIDAPKAKVCCQCGKDLTGQKRLRDSRGYWCYACHKLDQDANRQKGEKCADCGRTVAPSALVEVDGRRICSSCRNDRKQTALAERRRSGVSSAAFDQHAKSRFLWLLAVVAVLLAIIILRHFHIIGS